MFQLYSETLEGKETKNTAAAHLLSISRHQTPDAGNCSHVRTKCGAQGICHLAEAENVNDHKTRTMEFTNGTALGEKSHI